MDATGTTMTQYAAYFVVSGIMGTTTNHLLTLFFEMEIGKHYRKKCVTKSYQEIMKDV